MKTRNSFFASRFLAFVLVLMMLISLCVVPSMAADVQRGTDYTTVLVHGLMGWGEDDGLMEYFPSWGWAAGDVSEYLEGLGYDVYVASIGPFSSCWDRCCELYAQLTGTVVDYGQVHSQSVTDDFAADGYSMTHARYGRQYDAAVEGWGATYENGEVVVDYSNKLNLIGHSFGGPTSVMFLQLLAEGNEAERQWGKEQAAAANDGSDWHEYVSPLFWGDYEGEKLINSVTSVAGVLNGTTFISANDDAMGVMKAASALLANAAGVTDLCDLYDPQLEQFGLTAVDGMDVDSYFSLLMQSGFINGKDNALYDLTIKGTNALKQGWETYDNVYYFSYTGDKTYRAALNGKTVSLPDADMWAILLPFSTVMGSYTSNTETILNIDGTVWGTPDAQWQPNDGMVNTISAKYPLGADYCAYDKNNIQPGIWNVHEDVDYDHFEFIGGMYIVKPNATRAFYKAMMDDIAKAVPEFTEMKTLSAPTVWYGGKTLLGKVTLNWLPVKGASGYAIYRSTSANGNYVKIGSAVGSVFTDLTANRKTTYYYKLVAISGSADVLSSDFSAPFAVK